MKKLLLIIGVFICAIGYGQVPVDQDSIDATQDPTNAMYGLVFDNTAKKIYHMTMEYYLPWKYVSPLLYPRSIATNVLAGATTNPYSDKWYVNGTSTISGNLYGMNRIYVGSGRDSYLYTIGTQLYFYSPTTGSKSLAQLGSGGGIDLTTVPDKSIIVERADTAYGTVNFKWNDTTLTVRAAAATSSLYIGYNSGASSTSSHLYNTRVGNLTNSLGSSNTNFGASAGYNNTGSGNLTLGAFAGDTYDWISNGGIGNYSNQLFLDNANAADVAATGARDRFNALIWGDFANDSLRLNAKVHIGDSTYLDYVRPAASGTRFIVVTESAALDTGVLNPTFKGLQDPLWDIHKHLADRQNKEISFYHIDDKTGNVVKTYGLPQGMDIFEALQYDDEMILRLIAEQDKRIALLERKEYRMNRQDYKYKAKLLKLENRLK